MQLDHDWPREFEISRLRQLTNVQAAEIARLTAPAPPAASYSVNTPRAYPTMPMEGDEARHG
jgi:hypothetical protein